MAKAHDPHKQPSAAEQARRAAVARAQREADLRKLVHDNQRYGRFLVTGTWAGDFIGVAQVAYHGSADFIVERFAKPPISDVAPGTRVTVQYADTTATITLYREESR